MARTKKFKIEVEVDEDNLNGYYAFLGAAKDQDVSVTKAKEYVERPDLKGRTPAHFAKNKAIGQTAGA